MGPIPTGPHSPVTSKADAGPDPSSSVSKHSLTEQECCRSLQFPSSVLDSHKLLWLKAKIFGSEEMVKLVNFLCTSMKL